MFWKVIKYLINNFDIIEELIEGIKDVKEQEKFQPPKIKKR